MNAIETLQFDRRGLIPAVVQDIHDGTVLMVAYVNGLALEKTFSTGEVHFWSRSRDELWHKGETSGNRLLLRGARVDCDGDALLFQVEPTGPACHTGNRTCFFQAWGEGSA